MKSVFTIDYSKSLAFMIRVCDFDYVNPNITEQNFPKERSDGKANLNFELVPHNRKMSSEEVLADFQTKKLRSATLLEGLYWVKKNPEEQRKGSIVILGSIWRHWDGLRFVPYLCSVSGGRGLDLGWFGGGWVEGVWFLAVREPA